MSPEAMKEALTLRVSVAAEPLTIFVRKDSGETEVHRVRLTVSDRGPQLGHGDKVSREFCKLRPPWPMPSSLLLSCSWP